MSFKAIIITAVFLMGVYGFAKRDLSSQKEEILYIANINALLENCHCGNPSLGGLARIATVVNKKRRINPHLIFVDGGDFMNPYPYKEINNTVLNIYEYIKPDVLTLGENEFSGSIYSLKRYWQKFFHNTVCSNISLTGIHTNEYIRIKNFVIISYLDSKIFINPIPKQLTFDEDKFRRIYNKFKNRYLIVLYHGYTDNIERFAEKYPKIKIILAAHTDAGFQKKVGITDIVGSGTDGEYIIDIKIDKDGRTEFDKIAVGLDIAQNKQCMKYIKFFKAMNN